MRRTGYSYGGYNSHSTPWGTSLHGSNRVDGNRDALIGEVFGRLVGTEIRERWEPDPVEDGVGIVEALVVTLVP